MSRMIELPNLSPYGLQWAFSCCSMFSGATVRHNRKPSAMSYATTFLARAHIVIEHTEHTFTVPDQKVCYACTTAKSRSMPLKGSTLQPDTGESRGNMDHRNSFRHNVGISTELLSFTYLAFVHRAVCRPCLTAVLSRSLQE